MSMYVNENLSDMKGDAFKKNLSVVISEIAKDLTGLKLETKGLQIGDRGKEIPMTLDIEIDVEPDYFDDFFVYDYIEDIVDPFPNPKDKSFFLELDLEKFDIQGIELKEDIEYFYINIDETKRLAGLNVDIKSIHYYPDDPYRGILLKVHFD